MTVTIEKDDLQEIFSNRMDEENIQLPATTQLGLGSDGGGFSKIVTAQLCPVPRNLVRFMNNMKDLAQANGEDYYYSWEVKNKDGSKSTVEGGSIKLANDLAREYGNCITDVMMQDNGNEWIFYAKFIDLQTGFSMVRPFRQRKSQGSFKTDNERKLDIAFQIGASKAIRNVVLNALQTYSEKYFQEAKESLVNRIKANMDKSRDLILKGINENNYDLKLIEINIGRIAKDWRAEDMAKIISSLRTISDGMATFDELYPSQDVTYSTAETLNKELKEKQEKKPKAEKKPDPKPETKTDEEKVEEYQEAIKEAEQKQAEPVKPKLEPKSDVPAEDANPYHTMGVDEMPVKTVKDLELKGKELLRRIEDGGDKVELMEAFDSEYLLKKLSEFGKGILAGKIRAA